MFGIDFLKYTGGKKKKKIQIPERSTVVKNLLPSILVSQPPIPLPRAS